MQLDDQLVKSNLAHLNVFVALSLGCVAQLGEETFLLFNQPTEAASLGDKQKVKLTLHYDSQFSPLSLFLYGFLPLRHISLYPLSVKLKCSLTDFLPTCLHHVDP